nr:unnamed protein product [Spirometra erinaceieuropaei]
MAGVNVIAVGASEAAHKVFKAISEVASNSYKVLHLAEPNAANLLYVNGCLIHYDSDMIPNSTQIFENKIDYTRYPLSLPTLFKHGVPLYKLALLSDRCQVTFTPHSSGLLLRLTFFLYQHAGPISAVLISAANSTVHI